MTEIPPPLVSIGLPVFNGERFIARALEMLAAQTFTAYELVIIDNGSTDRTPEICVEYARRDPRIRYIRYERTVRVVANYCRALHHSRGTYFLWNAADDERPPDAIERALEALRQQPAAVMVHGPVEAYLVKEDRIHVTDNAIDLTAEDVSTRVAAFGRLLRHNGMLYGVYRRDVVVGLWFRQHVGHDYLLCLQMVLAGRIAYVDAPLIRYHHLYGPVDDPMYAPEPIIVKDLLAYWGGRRNKCWTVLTLGTLYVLIAKNVRLRDRVRGALSHGVAFTHRYWRLLLAETPFIATTPIAWLIWPIVLARHRRRRARAGARLPVG